MNIYNWEGRTSFYQWDIDQKLTALGMAVGEEVHFANVRTPEALVAKAYETENGAVVVDVPNAILCDPYDVTAYRFIRQPDGSFTKKAHTFKVHKRPKPAGYVYTEPEVTEVTAIVDKRLKEAIESGEIGSGGGDFDPTKYSLPIIYLEGDASAMTEEKNEVDFNYIYGDRSGTCKLKWQGSSSIAFPKKNYTIKFDNAFEAVSGWGEEKKYCLKADWVDFSHCRNVVSAKLWGDVVRSRASSDLVTRLSALPNCGAIDGFPCFVVINDEWMGVYNFNIPKDGWMMGMGSGEKEAIVCCEGVGDVVSNACSFNAEATLGTEFELEYSSDGWAKSEIQASLNNLIRAVMNSDGTDIDTTIAQHLDIDSAIDYMIFLQLINHHDGFRKNYILATYDGEKWFFSAYDMDNVFGQHYPGTTFDPASLGMLWCNANKLFNLLYEHKREALRDRLNELLTKEHIVQGEGSYFDGVMSLAKVAAKFTNYGSKIPLSAYVADAEKWTGLSSTNTNNVEQAIAWYAQRSDSLVKLYDDAVAGDNGSKGLTYQWATCSGYGSCCDINVTLGTKGSYVEATGELYTTNPYVVGAKAFINNSIVESVVMPDQYTKIYSQAFDGCTSLKEITFSKNITEIAWAAFQNCTSLKAVRMPAATTISSHIFRNCTSLVRVVIPKISSLPIGIFQGCTALTDIFYEGTTAEWEALEKGQNWNLSTGAYTVHCTDGDIAKA